MGLDMAKSQPAGGPLQPARSGLTVLFVDPDVNAAQRLARALPGQAVLGIAPTGMAAMNALRERLPSLIVMEMDLPDLSGVDLIGRIHSSPITRNILLMVVTQRSGVRDKIAAFEAGADDYLIKPLDPQQFLLHVQLLSRFRQLIGGY